MTDKKPYVIGKFQTWRELANLILTEIPEDLLDSPVEACNYGGSDVYLDELKCAVDDDNEETVYMYGQ